MKTTKATFEWNEKTLSKAEALYLALIEKVGLSEANKNPSLETIAKEIGAPSAQSIRSKLSTEKIYQKAATPRKVGGKAKVTKATLVRSLQKAAAAKNVDLNARKLESLEHATGADLADVVTLLNAYGANITVGTESEEAKAPRQETAKA